MKSGRAIAKDATLYIGDVLDSLGPTAFRLLKGGAIAVDDGGQILAVGRARHVRDSFPHAEEVDFWDLLMIPGLVDSHTHVSQYDAVAIREEGLLRWLRSDIYPVEASFQDLKVARHVARRFFQDLAKHGTTTASVFSTVHEEATEVVFEEARRSGLRALIGKTMMDCNCPPDLRESTADSIGKSERLYLRWNGKANGRLRYTFSPRFALTCSGRLLRGTARLASKHDAPMQTHLAETKEETRLAVKLHSSARNYTDIYRQAGLLRPKSIFAHSIYLKPSEIRWLAESGAGISHCPGSNLFLKSGFMDVQRILRATMNVGLGSDIGGSPDISIFRAMSMAGYSSKAGAIHAELSRKGNSPHIVTPSIAFYCATLGGARALGINDVAGNLREGKQADFLVLDTRPIDPLARTPREMTAERILSLLMYRASDQAVCRTYVDGKLVWKRES